MTDQQTPIPNQPPQQPVGEALPPETSAPVASPVSAETPTKSEAPKKDLKTVDHIDQTTIDNLKAKMRLMTELGLFGIGVILAMIIMFGYLSRSQVNQYQVNRQQIAAAMFNGSDIQNTVTFLENQQNQIDIINQALPNEIGFIEFVRTLEVLSNEYDPTSRFQFDRGQTQDGASFVPLTITLNTTSDNIILFLEKLEKIPYLLVIDSVQANRDIDSQDQWSYVISGKVFVSNNFRQN